LGQIISSRFRHFSVILFVSYQEICKKIEKEEFFCQADANIALEKLLKIKTKYYRIEAETREAPKYYRGRPKKDGEKKIREMRFGISVQIAENQDTIEKLREEAGCFVLLTNVPKNGKGCYSSREILRAYKDQYGIEQNFGFLKDPAIVNGIFLKKPERIEVLGLIFLLSLLIWRLIEHSMRRYIKEMDEDLPGWKKRRTKRPTSFMLVTKFFGVMVVKIGENRRLSKPLNSQQKEYLSAMEVEEEVFFKT